jgi:small basic protein (TIGR04137 family)
LAFADGRATYSVRFEPERLETQPLEQDLAMSQHRSLRAASTLGGKRNVLKRFERIELLRKRGQYKQGDRITGLRKTKPEA